LQKPKSCVYLQADFMRARIQKAPAQRNANTLNRDRLQALWPWEQCTKVG